MPGPWFSARWSQWIGLSTATVAAAAAGVGAAVWTPPPPAPGAVPLPAVCAPCVGPRDGTLAPHSAADSAAARREFAIAFVSIHATPRAAVSIDGIEVGETPIERVPLEVGEHTFRAVLPDGRVLE